MIDITEVNIKHINGSRLLAFIRIVLSGCFVIDGMRIIQTADGKRFIEMPQRELTDKCPRCGKQNSYLNTFCTKCSLALTSEPPQRQNDGKPLVYVDFCHPITSECREYIEKTVFDVFDAEQSKTK